MDIGEEKHHKLRGHRQYLQSCPQIAKDMSNLKRKKSKQTAEYKCKHSGQKKIREIK